MDVAANWKVVVIHVLYHLCKAFKKIHVRLVKELEKKFSGKDVVFDATRRIVRPLKKGSAVHHPRTRTLIAIHDGILEDVVSQLRLLGSISDIA
uniref:40S ribosomal protein S7 n=1 Tax=Oryza nivara TaxID=4536 RepID=A0A0E0G5R7_ORYNI